MRLQQVFFLFFFCLLRLLSSLHFKIVFYLHKLDKIYNWEYVFPSKTLTPTVYLLPNEYAMKDLINKSNLLQIIIFFFTQVSTIIITM